MFGYVANSSKPWPKQVLWQTATTCHDQKNVIVSYFLQFHQAVSNSTCIVDKNVTMCIHFPPETIFCLCVCTFSWRVPLCTTACLKATYQIVGTIGTHTYLQKKWNKHISVLEPTNIIYTHMFTLYIHRYIYIYIQFYSCIYIII